MKQVETTQLDTEFSSSDEAKIREIITGVLSNNPEYLTKDVHDQFWVILQKYGYSPIENDLNKIKYQFASLNTEMKYFYEDALISYQNGKVMKSDIREQYEKKLLKEQLITQEKLTQNEEILKNIALQEPVTSNGQTVLFNEENINSSLENLNQADERLTQLFMPINSVNKQETKQEPVQEIQSQVQQEVEPVQEAQSQEKFSETELQNLFNKVSKDSEGGILGISYVQQGDTIEVDVELPEEGWDILDNSSKQSLVSQLGKGLELVVKESVLYNSNKNVYVYFYGDKNFYELANYDNGQVTIAR